MVRNKITKMAEELFEVAKENDPEIQEHLSDIQGEYKKLIPN